MHIPDGLVDLKTAAATGALAAAGLGVALRHARLTLPARRVPLLGLSAAFVFVAQMLNFPVGAGTSGHLVGGVLAAALLGPSAAVVVLSAVLIVQCLLFADGGLTALGANVFNMAIVGTVGGWAAYELVRRSIGGSFGRVVGATVGGWCGTVLAAVACAGELAASNLVSWSVALPAMVGVHMMIGLGEGVITALVLSAVSATRPELLEPAGRAAMRSVRPVLVYGLVITAGLALFVSPFVCPWPDGLEKVAEGLGFAQHASEAPVVAAVAADYRVPGVGSVTVATSLAAGAGMLVVSSVAWVLARALVPRRRPEAAPVTATSA